MRRVLVGAVTTLPYRLQCWWRHARRRRVKTVCSNCTGPYFTRKLTAAKRAKFQRRRNQGVPVYCSHACYVAACEAQGVTPKTSWDRRMHA